MNINDKVIVFLSTSEEAQLMDDPNTAGDPLFVAGTKISNTWTWITPAETVESTAVSFDATNNVNIVTVTGTSFGEDPALFELWIDGVK